MAARKEASAARQRLLQGALVGLGGAALALALQLLGVLASFEAKTWDMRARLLAKPGPATSQVVTILIDQYSLDWCKENLSLAWPWPRETYRAVTDFCARGGAKALVFDMIYSEPSAYGGDNGADDRGFRDSLKGYGKVVGAMLLGSTNKNAATSWRPDLPGASPLVSGLEGWLSSARPEGISFPRAEFPTPEIASGMSLLANTNLPPDTVDGVYRSEPLFNVFDGRVVPTEALAAYLVGAPGPHALSVSPGSLVVDGRSIPIDPRGRALLRYRGPSQTHESKGAASVIQAETRIENGEPNDFDPAFFKDKYVLFGVSASGLYDLKPTPMSGAYPGVEVNATMLDNLLSGDFMKPVPPIASALLLLALCLGAGAAVSASTGAARNALTYLGFVAAAPALGVAAYAAGYQLQVVALELGGLVALVGSSLLSYATEGRQKRYIKGAFKQYLSPEVIDQLIAHPERLKLGGERRELSIFFSDMQGFTSVSETLTPEELTALLNDYLSAMTDIIQEEGGTIDKYEGDAIIAFWNAPLELPDHAARAVRAALRCQERLAELRPAFRARVGKDLFMRVGINSGPAVVGNMGSRTRFDYTMLGDAVNLASRLEGINKQYGTYTMISASTLKLLGEGFPARELSRVAVVGRKEAVTVYEPMSPAEREARLPTLRAFASALDLYYAGDFRKAEEAFRAIAAVDPPAAAYAAKCAELALSPPAGPWNGVWVMTSK